jgi:hypothetical protein
MKNKMNVVAAIGLMAFLSHSLLADDMATPTPTPVYSRHPARPASVRRMEQLERRRALDTEVQANGTARAQAKAQHLATAKAQADARATTRERERAQRKVDAEARSEAAKETPRATSDLMKRMGFSEQDISAQKALEDSTKPGATVAPSSTNTAAGKPAAISPAPSPASH